MSDLREGLPLLCLDTCAVLDVLRDPLRGDAYPDDHAASQAPLRCAEVEDRLVVFTTDVVRAEFSDNVHAVQTEAEASIAKLAGQIASMNRLAALYDSQGQVDLSHWDGHVQRCRRVADRWMEAGTALSRSDEIDRRAMRRVFEGRRPSRRGKDSTKDCVILETYLEHVRTTRAAGATAPAVFLSSNVRDFGGGGPVGVAEEIAQDFKAVNLLYASGMAGAKRLLGL